MASYPSELLATSERLLARRRGQRGPLSSARIRRSISTSYYALFHFLAEESGYQIIGTGQDLLARRRIFARTFTHRGLQLALSKVSSERVHPSVQHFFRLGNEQASVVMVPAFVRTMARAFIQAQDLRHSADYDLNEILSIINAKELVADARAAIQEWMGAASIADRRFKNALCVLMCLRGKLRSDEG